MKNPFSTLNAKLNANLNAEQKENLITFAISFPLCLALGWYFVGDLFFVKPLQPVTDGVSHYVGGLAGLAIAAVLQIVTDFLLSFGGCAAAIIVVVAVIDTHLNDRMRGAALCEMMGVMVGVPLIFMMMLLFAQASAQGILLGPVLGLVFAVVSGLVFAYTELKARRRSQL
jgi:hypothetical protein